MSDSRYWDNVTAIFEWQRNKGLKSYGQTLEDNDTLNIIDSIVMAQEELVDLLVYLEKLKELMLHDRSSTKPEGID